MNSRPSGFEERLKGALLARLPEAAPAPPARSFARRYGIPLAVGVATATVVAVTTLTGSIGTGSLPAGTPSRSASDAPEITREPDGSLRFDPPQEAQVPALVDRLKDLGVRVALVPKVPESECDELRNWISGPKAADPTAGLSRGDDGRTLRVNPKAVPPGHTLALTWADYYPVGTQALGFRVFPNSDVPSCVDDPMEGFLKTLPTTLTPPNGKPTPVAPNSTP